MYDSNIIKGLFGLDIREYLDDSMLPITKEPTKTGLFYYVGELKPKFKIKDTKDYDYGKIVYGIYENDKNRVWTEDKNGSYKMYKYNELELV